MSTNRQSGRRAAEWLQNPSPLPPSPKRRGGRNRRPPPSVSGRGFPRGVRAALAVLLCASLPGCMQQMANQPAYRPLQASSFFPDGRSARPLVPGTVARGDLRADTAFYTGLTGKTDEASRAAGVIAVAGQPFAAPALFLVSDPYEADFPLPITKELLRRGQERFNIFCAVCHDRAGTGEGMIKQRGFTPPPTFHQPRLRQAPVGYIFSVITRGYGAMPDYAAQIPPHDRWAIVLYVRTLQIREHAPVAALPPALVKQLKEGPRK